MPLLTIFLTIFFLLVGFLPTGDFLATGPFFSFILHLGNILLSHLTLFLICLFIIVFFLIRSYRMEKKFPVHKKILFSLFHIGVVSILSFFLAFALLYLIAFSELNLQALFMNMNPYGFGVTTNTDEIVSALEDNDLPPEIILSDHDQKRIAQAVSYAITGKESFYGRYILRSIPGAFMLPVHSLTGSMALIDKTLIITEINPSDLQKISPIIGYLYVKKYFPTREIKKFPRIYFLTQNQYVTIRSHDADSKIVTIDKDMTITGQAISSLSASLKANQDDLTKKEKDIDDKEYQREVAYNKCLRDNVEEHGGSQSDYQDTCQKVRDSYNTTIPARASLTSEKNKIASDQNQLALYKYYYNFFTVQKQLLANSKNTLPFELGAFEPEKNIGILLNTSEPTRIADYFETVVHEYLHYASYVPNKRLASGFFEEGLTEYFARQTIQDTLNTKTNLGYPLYVHIISEIMKIIPESELADIYFTKDELGLEQAMDRVYGDGFYQKNIVLFDSLQYTGNPTQSLNLANKIMKKIGGRPLTQNDLKSNISTLNE